MPASVYVVGHPVPGYSRQPCSTFTSHTQSRLQQLYVYPGFSGKVQKIKSLLAQFVRVSKRSPPVPPRETLAPGTMQNTMGTINCSLLPFSALSIVSRSELWRRNTYRWTRTRDKAATYTTRDKSAKPYQSNVSCQYRRYPRPKYRNCREFTSG